LVVRYGAIVGRWDNAGPEFIAFLDYAIEIRRVDPEPVSGATTDRIRLSVGA
jgi:hypothetical protein